MRPTVCRLLRCKSAQGRLAGQDWREGQDPAASYWCLGTMEVFGPDEHHVHALDCQEGRCCFQRAPEDEPLLASADTAGEG